jgi:small subunit ribosomal protein S2
MLTNFQTVSTRVKRMKEFEAMQKAGDFDAMPKKEALRHTRELEKLQRNLGGIRGLDRLPDAIFVIDTKKEHIAVTEANKLGLPVVAVVDTNCDPDVITHVIPGNDDAIRSGALLCRVVADAVVEGRFIAQQRPRPPHRPGLPSRLPPTPPTPPRVGGLRGRGACGGDAPEPDAESVTPSVPAGQPAPAFPTVSPPAPPAPPAPPCSCSCSGSLPRSTVPAPSTDGIRVAHVTARGAVDLPPAAPTAAESPDRGGLSSARLLRQGRPESSASSPA